MGAKNPEYAQTN